jgi:hypothetical protein
MKISSLLLNCSLKECPSLMEKTIFLEKEIAEGESPVFFSFQAVGLLLRSRVS